MRVIVCLDDKNGMLFNKRRQSRDRVVVEDIQEKTAGCKLWMNAYSAKLFEDTGNICIEEDFLAKSQAGEYCFVEDKSLATYEDEIEELIVYRWGRVYPSDKKIDIDLNGYTMTCEDEIVGFSHPEMKRQIYIKEGSR